ncbi:MAG: branched-chain amino acid ABC transporter permease [Acidimicrobiia bacterium]|nr:MAG: branched-chain amino acid ABC transporter permease [Acidimicrobiia bacterium]
MKGPTGWVKLGLLVASLAVGVALPYLVDQFLVGIVTLALITGLFAMSIDLLAGYGGLVTLGQAGISAAASYGVAYMSVKAGAGHLAQVGVGLLAGLIVSAVFAVMIMRSSGVYFMMITLAQGMIIWGLSIRLTRITGAENGLPGVDRPEFLSLYWQYYWFVLAVVLICSAMLYVIVRSPFGLALEGLRESESRLLVLGYNTSLQKFYAFMVSGFFATVAGILLVYLNQFISPSSAHLTASALGVLQTILGGVGTLVGPMIGSFIVVYLRNVVSQDFERWPTLMGLLFIVVVLFARRGLVGELSERWRAWLTRRGLAVPLR